MAARRSFLIASVVTIACPFFAAIVGCSAGAPVDLGSELGQDMKKKRDAGSGAVDSGGGQTDAGTGQGDAVAGQNDLATGADGPDTPGSAVAPGTMNGTGQLLDNDPQDCFKFTLTAGQTLTVGISVDGRIPGNTLTVIGDAFWYLGGDPTWPGGVPWEDTSGAKDVSPNSIAYEQDSVTVGPPPTGQGPVGDWAVCIDRGQGTLAGTGVGTYTAMFTIQ
jgi:hypothetical protein